MNTPITCSQCGATLGEPTADGLCPKCLLALGVATRIMTLAGPEGVTRSWDGAFPEPLELGPYRILRLLGQGGMGTVYEAEDTRSGRVVALKVLGKFFDSAEMRQRFLREGQLAASVRHPNVVAVLAAEEIDDTAVLAMEIVPDGTLRDRVKARGPLDPAAAIEATLQIIDGLEEAQAHGVLHRDVKPANCFITSDSTVKVGDFGLSISTLARPDAHLTRTGAIMGTPAFASPEQLRGSAVDVRSDIYAVGATLYFLLTGRATHDADSLPALIAAVLEQTPPEPRAIRPEVPRNLSRVVMRCLAQNREARFAGYAELRRALMLCSSGASAPATLGLRFVAGIIDGGLSLLPLFAWMALTGDYALDEFLITRSASGFRVAAAGLLSLLAYGTLFEGLWGTSPGKALCGLAVSRPGNGRGPGIPRAAIRAAIYFGFPELARYAVIMATMSAAEYERGIAAGGWVVVGDALSFLAIVLLFSTLRRSNGFAAVHDLVSGTRVVARSTRADRRRLATPAVVPPAFGTERLGPYGVIGRQGDWVFGWDEILRRPVWIRMQPAGAPIVTPVRRDLNRPTRLRWLNGQRSEACNWDAYEAPAGTPLTARLDHRQPWADVRFWVHDLADEVSAARADGTVPARVGASQVWLTANSRAVLVEYPVPGAPPMADHGSDSDREIEQLLSEMIASATDQPLPLHAQAFVATMQNGRFDAPGVVAGNLRALLSRPARVSRARRALGLALPVVISLLCAIAGAAVVLHINRDFDAMAAEVFPGRRSPRLALDLHFSDRLAGSDLEPLAIHLGGHYGDQLRRSEFWDRPEALALTFRSTREFARAAAEKFGNVDAERLRAADAVLEDRLREARNLDQAVTLGMLPGFFFALLAILQLVAILPAPWLRAPLGLRWIGMAVVKNDGRPASSARIAIRCLLSILPTLACALTAALVVWMPGEVELWVFSIIAGGVLAGLGIWTILRPSRAVADLLAGTALVMR